MPENKKKGRDKLQSMVSAHRRNEAKADGDQTPKKIDKLSSLVGKSMARRNNQAKG